ncbi:MAG TPA: type III-B CRISPR module RAMP protein Cmr4 [Dictyoglomaceae bacterium]|nr:type III-B CRISPR module RAMP protein Cmr4 [Dictyoglomaceae bacterium]HPU44045.1 type III-B CRISPR module RAMP protein Cmr4 [Dictyoglomaceae bacterium]
MDKPKKYFAITLDPVHIGAGGYRLGRVDNTIVRDPTTDVPKIPGTSLAGVIRAFAELVKTEDEKKTETGKKFKNINIETVFGDENKQGMVRFYDGQIIFFPVSSIEGTVWITTKELLEYWLRDIKGTQGEGITIPDEVEDKAYAIKGVNPGALNLGWLLLEVQDIASGRKVALPPELEDFLKRIVVVSDKLFSHLVNDNLEVRTSVRIDTKTGTAAKRALFTYEAIPRGTVLVFEMVIDTRRENVDDIETLIKATFPYLKLLGVGGLGTRGFGRIEILNGTTNQSSEGGGSNDKS